MTPYSTGCPPWAMKLIEGFSRTTFFMRSSSKPSLLSLGVAITLPQLLENRILWARPEARLRATPHRLRQYSARSNMVNPSIEVCLAASPHSQRFARPPRWRHRYQQHASNLVLESSLCRQTTSWKCLQFRATAYSIRAKVEHPLSHAMDARNTSRFAASLLSRID